jgi:hypothetical protein
MWLADRPDIVESMPLLGGVREQALAFLDLMLGALPIVDDATFDSLLTGGRDALVAEWAAFQATTPLVVTPVMSTQPTCARCRPRRPARGHLQPACVRRSTSSACPRGRTGRPGGSRPIGLRGSSGRRGARTCASPRAEVLEAASEPMKTDRPRWVAPRDQVATSAGRRVA